MRIVICGGSGFIGTNLAQHLLDQGHHVSVLDRNRSKLSSPHLLSFQCNLLRPDLFEQKWFDGANAVINLSGKDIFTLWTKRTKKMIWESRIQVNRNLVDFIGALPQKPEVFVSASAVGYYGDKGDKEVSEEDARGKGFLADVCEGWETEAKRAESLGMRSVQVRTAPVLLKSGGILMQLLKSMNFGFTFVFGSGQQWFPWLHMTDLTRIYEEAITNRNLSGPVNAASPNPMRFRDLLSCLTCYKKAVILPLPVFLLKLLLQETADVVLFSQRVLPVKLTNAGFQFSYPELDQALKEIFSK
jgi:uncharacterized protein